MQHRDGAGQWGRGEARATGDRRTGLSSGSLVTMLLVSVLLVTVLLMSVLLVSVLAGSAVSGGSMAVSTRSPALAQTLEQRDRASAAAHAATLERGATFLRDKWGPVALPNVDVERWVAAPQWGTLVARCVSDAGFPGVVPADGGERLDFSGVRTRDPRELFEIDVATYTCGAQFPVRSWYESEVRDIEAPWALEFTRSAMVPCLLAHGYLVPSLPDDARFRADWRTDGAFDPYSLVGQGVSDRSRAQSRCPAPETILDAAP